jgi:O-antigen ligase
MTTLAYAALWIFVFSIPWEGILVLPGVAVVPRLTGITALGLTLLAIGMSGRFRRWRPFHIAAFLFVLCTGGELLLINVQGLPNKYWTFVQLFLVLFMIWELAATWRRQLGLLTAYVMGAQVGALATILVYRRQAGLMRRYAAGAFDPNDLAMTLALALPMAWYLGMNYRQPLLRWACRAYLPIGLVAIGLTGSRGGMLASVVALLIVPLTMTKLSPGRLAAGIAMLAVAGSLAVAYVPQKIVARLATTGTEVQDLSFGGRFKLWKAGLNAFTQKPWLGYGTARFKQVITPQLGTASQVAHNSFVSILVEEGLLGFLLYTTMLLTAFRAVLKLPLLERRFALVLLATLGVAMLPLTWEDSKSAWFILAALVGAAHAYPGEVGSTAWHGHPSHPVPVTGARARPRPRAPLRAPAEEARPDSSA